jgi:hypothetical protein
LGVPGTCPNIRGDLRQNSIIGPGLINVDFSMVKNNYVPSMSESFDVQFRADSFNVVDSHELRASGAGRKPRRRAT